MGYWLESTGKPGKPVVVRHADKVWSVGHVHAISSRVSGARLLTGRQRLTADSTFANFCKNLINS